MSVHDVTPAHEAALRGILRWLAARGVGRTSLLVIPDHHAPECGGAWSLARHPRFADWLRDLEARGHEVVLHGLQHCDPTPRAGTPWQRIVRRVATVEAEFYTLAYDEARERIDRGVRLLAGAGFSPRGFVAPAWLHNGAVLRAVRDAGLRYVTSLGAVTDLERRVTLRARAVCFSSRSPARARASAAFGAVHGQWARRHRLVRVAIHPGDLAQPTIAACLRSILARLAGTHDFVAYRDLMARP